MSFVIVGDSCCDFTQRELQKDYVKSAPLILTVGDREFIDDENIDTQELLKCMRECEDAPRSACPSPESFLECYGDADEIYVITLSSKLSGSYNSAMVARQLYLADHPDAKVHVFDSRSAAAAEHLIFEKIEECALAGMKFEDVVSTVKNYISNNGNNFLIIYEIKNTAVSVGQDPTMGSDDVLNVTVTAERLEVPVIVKDIMPEDISSTLKMRIEQ